jgi:pimeloyl-ACP methyl ester carboxylesterase
MTLRSLLGAAVGTVGVTVLANRLLASRARDFEPVLPGDRGSYRWRGFDVAYAELGDPADQDLVLLHGVHAAASGHEYWAVAADLAEDYHVLVPDLPGFGHSDRPALFYSASLYTTFVGDFIADTTDEPPVVVASSLTGSYAAGAARNLDLSELVLICPSGGVSSRRRRWLRALLRSPLVGQGLFNLIASKSSIRHFHADHGVVDLSRIPADVIDYEWESAHQPGARFAPASFVSGHLDPDVDLAEVLGDLGVPVTLVWGTETDMPPLSTGRELAEAADVELVSIGDSALLPHVEHPAEFLDVVRGEPVESGV